MSEPRSFKKPLLYALIASVIAGALLGIVLVLRNTWGWFEVRVILTTAVVAGASLCGLACDLSKMPFGSHLLPRFGLLMTGVSSVLILTGLWGDIDSAAYWKGVSSVSVLTVATVHVCLLSIAKLVRRFRWVYLIGCQIIFGLAGLIVFIIVSEASSEGLWRFLAALAIVAAAVTLVIPILHRIGRMESNSGELLMPVDARSLASIESEIQRLQTQINQLERVRNKILGDVGGEGSPAAVGKL